MKTFVLWMLLAAVLTIAAPASWSKSDQWSLHDTKGQVVAFGGDSTKVPALLVFWATWCIPCKKEMSDNKLLFDDYQNKGVSVLLISEDNARTSSKVKPYVESKGFAQRVLLDEKGEILKRYGGSSLPFTVLLDKQQNVVQKIRGAVKDTGALTKQINQLLEATP